MTLAAPIETGEYLRASSVEFHRGPGRRRSLRLRASGHQDYGSQRADHYANTQGDDEAETAAGWGLVLRLIGEHCLGVLRNRRAVKAKTTRYSFFLGLEITTSGIVPYIGEDGGEFMFE